LVTWIVFLVGFLAGLIVAGLCAGFYLAGQKSVDPTDR
jgi:uncharacterized membrane protein